jgi:predicted enzyme related to lactoylglutathione lyase
MPLKARYAHTNLVTADWRRLVDFYITLFGCTVVPPERDYSGAAIDALTGLTGVRLTGMHLRLPGYGDDGPTLEILSYAELAERPPTAANRPAFGHIAFAVDDVPAARAAVLAAGGRSVGDVVTLTTSVGSRVTCCYVTDIDGNIVELQAWS